MTTSHIPDLKGLPFYPEPMTFLSLGGRLWAWEFNGWKAESLSWKTGCYIHTGLSGPQFIFEGSELAEFFSSICVNSFAKFPIGSMKHAIMCTDDGLIASHGILQRNAEQEYRYFAGGPWPLYKLSQSKFDVKARVIDGYLTQVAGPTSLETLERATGESLRDVGFLKFRNTTIAGKDVEIGRIGMSGNLAFEVRGPIEDGPAVYDAIYQAGQGLGIQRLGWRTYLVNHVEGGFPQQSWTFSSAANEDPGFQAVADAAKYPATPAVSGSVDPADMRARYRTPIEVGWDRAVRLDHDFVGRAALEQEVAQPRRTVATLRWNAEDVVDIYASLLRPGEEYKTIDLPTSPTWLEGRLAHADHLLKDGRPVGMSSGTIYSYHFREVLSMACIDIDLAKVGTEVTVAWGDYGGRIKHVRATVERFPYLTEGRNDAIDLPTLSKSSPEKVTG